MFLPGPAALGGVGDWKKVASLHVEHCWYLADHGVETMPETK